MYLSLVALGLAKAVHRFSSSFRERGTTLLVGGAWASIPVTSLCGAQTLGT